MTQSEMIHEINRLKKEKNAVILAHYYQSPIIQDLADFVGDSYQLSKEASKTDADMIVFCGVHFMAETAKILAPEKTVLLPAKDAGCPMADTITYTDLKQYKEKNPDRKIVCYVNSTAEVKALSDVCVTSSNAEKIIRHFEGEKLMYVPDKNLGTYLADRHQLDLDVWPGFCCIHNNLTVEQVQTMKAKYPDYEFIVHPEAQLDVVNMADYVGSTKGLLEYVKSSSSKGFIVGTEEGILHQMKKQTTGKDIVVLTEKLLCKSMKKTELKTLYEALRDDKHQIEVDQTIAVQARKALDLMLELSETS